MTIGERIKSLRIEKGYTQKELAKLSSVSEISIRKYENGDRQPKQTPIHMIARVLDVSEAWLMGYDVPMDRNKENGFIDDQTNEIQALIKYLESIKYLVRIEQKADQDSYCILLIKDGLTTTFDNSEFLNFRNTIEKSIAFEIFKKSQQA